MARKAINRQAQREVSADTYIAKVHKLRVVISRDGEQWLAQGCEIDYFAGGASIEEAKINFQDGLTDTIQQYLQTYGDIKGLLKVAPQEVWDELYAAESHYTYSSVSLHEVPANFPYGGIEFLEAA